MSFNGSGVYSLPGAALANGATVSATEHNQFRNDVATALNLCVLKDGQQTITANLPMNGKKITGLAAGSASGDAVRYEQVCLYTGTQTTPAAWSASVSATELQSISLYGNATTSVYASNLYANSSGVPIFKADGWAQTYRQESDGSHTWKTSSASGAAGSGVTLTNLMTLTAAGSLSATAINSTPIGATTPSTGAFTTLSASDAFTSGTTGTNGRLNLNRSSDGATLFTLGVDDASTVSLNNGTVGTLNLKVNSATVAALTTSGLSVTGAISASGNGTGTDESGASFRVGPGTTNVGDVYMYAGLNNASNYGYLGVVEAGIAYRDLVLQPNGGNLGIGVTPSGWVGVDGAIELQNGGFVGAQGTYFYQGANVYYSSAWKYKTSVGGAALYTMSNGTHSWQVAPSGTAGNPITFTQAMTLDSSGNLGLGVTPSAWGGWKAINLASIRGTFVAASETDYVTSIGQNCYFNGTNWIYAFSSGQPTTRFDISRNGFSWHTAPSGTAGSAISFGDPKMTLDASGNLGVGTTSPGAKLHIGGTSAGTAQAILTNGVTDPNFQLWVTNGATGTTSGTNQATIGLAYNGAGFGSKINFIRGGGATDGIIAFETQGSERARIDASGNLLVGTTTFGQPDVNAAAIGSSDGSLRSHHATGTASGAIHAYFTYGGLGIGSITQNGTTAVAYNTTSDYRIKTNIRKADAKRFNDINFVDFEYIDGRHDCGVIAHELQAIYPDLVVGEKDAVEVRQVEISPAIPAVTEERLVSEAVFNGDGEEIEPAVYETVEITPAVEAVFEEQEFPVYQQVNYPGLIGRMGARIQMQDALIQQLLADVAELKGAK